MNRATFYQQVYALVRRVPQGRVTTYGRIAAQLHRPQAARAVGYALRALRGPELARVPWQRVINAQGRISLKSADGGELVQKKLLEAEGLGFRPDGSLELKRYLWKD